MKQVRLAAVAVLAVLSTSALGAAEKPCSSVYPESLVSALVKQAPGLRPNLLRLALDASRCAADRGLLRRPNLLTVIDYSLPSSQKRLFVFDLDKRKILYRELVAHGKNSGGDLANFFSNSHGSLASSLGLFVTGETYFGSNGYSLRLRGLEHGVNDRALDRAIVMHGAYYVSQQSIQVLGRLGRSWGCPAVRLEIARELINMLRGGSAVFAYYPDRKWLGNSAFLRQPSSQTAANELAASSR